MSAAHIHSTTQSRLFLSLILTIGFVIFEIIAAYRSHSLALLSDAGHNLTDVIALVLTLYAVYLTSRPANARKTFGYHRVGILVALINSVSLIGIALGIFYQAYQRILQPLIVDAPILITVASIAFIINTLTAWLLMHGSEHDLNLRSAFLHLLADALSTLAAIIAGVIIYWTGLSWLDSVVSIIIGLLIIWNAIGILQESINILLENTPTDIDSSKIVRDLMSIHGVKGVHDLHIWSISQQTRLLTAHIVTEDMNISQSAVIQQQIHRQIHQNYGINHSTLQIECVNCEPNLLYCDLESHKPVHCHHD
ncbi:MAG: hypothetical protein RL637_1367 [Pseudomonadota bacterium]|jgi:cobalt-zinc-cadmium efflux system protein